MKHTNNVQFTINTKNEGIRDLGLGIGNPKHLCLLFLILASLSFAQTNWSSLANTEWYTSTVQTSFTLTTSAQLAGLAKLVNAGNNFSGKTIVLGNNIELNDTENWDGWSGENVPTYSWTPIGTDWETHNFQGTFDGNGYVVSGIYIHSEEGELLGLFGTLGFGGTIKNIGVTASYIYGNDNVGVLAGYNYGGTISNCYTSGKVHRSGTIDHYYGAGGAGGIVGNAMQFGDDDGDTKAIRAVISNCYSTAIVSGDQNINVGGLLGLNSWGTDVTNSYYNSQVYLGENNGYGTPKTTADMQDDDFVKLLNFAASASNMNAWEKTNGGYPVLTNKIAEFSISDYLTEGNGAETNPYIIRNKADLEYFSLIVNNGESFLNQFIKLGNNIALNSDAETTWQTWSEDNAPAYSWTQIGSSWQNAFRGTFDGDGKTISGIYIYNQWANELGLFGVLGNDGIIKNLGVTASYIYGNDNVGILAGVNNNGTINNSYASGKVNGSRTQDYSSDGSAGGIGGLIGYNAGGTITNSYSTAIVSGGNGTKQTINVGGLVGQNEGGNVINSFAIGNVSADSANVGGLVGYNKNYGTIRNSYSAGKISGSEFNLGGLVGQNSSEGTTIINSYYDSKTSGRTDTNKGTPKTTEEMKSDGFAFVLNIEAVFLAMNGWVYTAGNYPALSDKLAKDVLNIADYFASGTGSSTDPYIIKTKEQLENLATFVNLGYSFEGSHFKLGNGIKLNEDEEADWQTWSESKYPTYKWTSIGTFDRWDDDNDREIATPFSGTFDGDGYVISGVYINNNSNHQGLFGYINGGTIKNLGVVNSYIKGNEQVGGLLGYSNGTIINSYVNANVSGSSYVGGLVGRTDGSSISNSYAKGNVTASGGYNEHVGGLVGYNGEWGNSTITNSYAMATVSGNSNVGGLVGYNGGNNVYGANGTGTIINSYSTGAVSGNGGGLIGSNYSGRGVITNSFYDRETSGKTDNNKGTPKTTDEMKDIVTYISGGWDFTIWTIDSEVNSGYPFHRTKQSQPSIADAQVAFSNQRLTEDGTPTTIEIYRNGNPVTVSLASVMLYTTALSEETDYQILYSNNSEPGIAKIILLGSGNYSGAVVLDFYITASRNLNTVMVDEIPDQVLAGSDKAEPKPVVKDVFSSVTVILAEGIDYNFEYENNDDAGTATIIIYASAGLGVYGGTRQSVDFEIVGSKDLSKKGEIAFANKGETYTYNGKQHTPEVIVSYQGISLALVEGNDYKITYGDNTNVGEGKITVNGINDYSGKIEIDFTIDAKNMESETIYVMSIPAQIYTGSAITPPLTIIDQERSVELELGKDYKVTYSNRTNVSTDNNLATVYIEGIGNYTGEVSTSFRIVLDAADIVKVEVVWEEPFEFTYDGTEKKPYASAELANGTPVTLTINGGAINAGEYTAIATTISGYELTNATVQFKINKASIAATLSISDVNIGVTPSPSVSNNPGDGAVTYLYSLSESGEYSETVPNTSGIYFVKAVIAATTNYESYTTEVKSFSITNPLATKVEVTWNSGQTFNYNGTEQKPTATASLVGGGTLDIVISGATDAGLHTAVARIANPDDAAEYELTNATFQFYIGSRNISAATIEPISDKAATGSPIKPSVVITDLGKTLVEGKDYELSYDNNVEAGTGIVTATGIGNYTYFIEQTFTILEGFINIAVVWGSLEFTYNGAEQKPTATATTPDGELALTITGGKTNAGTYTATATLATPSDLYALTNETKQFTIAAKTLASNAIQAIASVTATGSQITPTVVVKDGEKTLVLGTDYEVSYGANTAAGTNAGTVTVTGKGNYKGTAEATFTINEAPSITEPIEDPYPCEEDPSSCANPVILPQIALGQISVQPVSGGILLENLPSNAKVEIFNLQGKQVYSAMSVEAQCIVPLQTKGMYIVKVGTQTFRTTVR